MKKILLLGLFFYSFLSISAQYTEIINSKRPGFSESPYGVGTKIFQVETGGFYLNTIKSNETFLTRDSYGGNLFLRYSNFLEKLEINLDTRYQKDTRVFNNVLQSNPYSISGFSRLTLGAKYLVYNAKYKDKSKEIRSWKKRHAFDWTRLIPSVGVYAGWNSNFLTEAYKAEKMSFKGAILLQQDINERFVILTNLIVDDILLENTTYSYILTSTLAVTGKWSIFGEHQGVFNKSRPNDYQFGGGAAYLLSNDIQLDIAGRVSRIESNFTNYTLSLGGAWRLNRHIKKKTTTLEGTKEPFFKRIFKKRSKKKRVKKVKIKKRRKSKKSKGPSFYKKKKKRKKRRKKD